MAQVVKNPPAIQETWVQSLGWEDPLEKVMATHSSSPWGCKESDMTEQLSLRFTSPGDSFPGGAVLQNPDAREGDTRDRSSIPGL